jgi:hypothetical protein
MASTSPPIKAFHPADWNVNASVSSWKSPLKMPHFSFGSTVLEDGVTEDGVEDGVVELGCEDGSEEASPHATRNNAARVDIVSACFLFMMFSFTYE